MCVGKEFLSHYIWGSKPENRLKKHYILWLHKMQSEDI